MVPDRLQEIRARLDAATPGPWDTEGPCMSGDGTYGVWSEAAPGEPTIAHRMAEADADFIAHSRDDVAWLLAEVERLRKQSGLAAAAVAWEYTDTYHMNEILREHGVSEQDAKDEADRRYGDK